MSLGELYGEYDLSTNEWTDGVLSSIMRAACAGEHFTSLNYAYMSFTGQAQRDLALKQGDIKYIYSVKESKGFNKKELLPLRSSGCVYYLCYDLVRHYMMVVGLHQRRDPR